jgi:hypothetical protein
MIHEYDACTDNSMIGKKVKKMQIQRRYIYDVYSSETLKFYFFIVTFVVLSLMVNDMSILWS